MEKSIIRDTFLLSRKSAEATADDLPVAADLLDTLRANADRCVGMAANMIGVSKRILAFDNGGEYMVMINPVITAKTGMYTAEEGCLSLDGTRPAVRYRKIKVQWQDMQLRPRTRHFEGFPAQIIQHEIDHFDGILI